MHEVMKELRRAVYKETVSTVEVIEIVAKLEREKHFLRYGFSSLHQYLVRGLKYSDGAANRRIRAARLYLKKPEVCELLRRREVSLCTLSEILDEPEMLSEIKGKSKREVEELVALKSGKDTRVRERVVPVVVKKAVEQRSAFATPPVGGQSVTPPPVVIRQEMVLEERLKVTFSYSREKSAKIEQAREILSRKYSGKGVSIEDLFLEGIEQILAAEGSKKEKMGTRKERGSKNRRYISPKVKKEVLERDGGCCTYRNKDGSVCGSRWSVEFDHIKPVAIGGVSSVENLRLLCRNHNQLMARDAGLIR